MKGMDASFKHNKTIISDILTHCGPVMPHDDLDLAAPSHYQCIISEVLWHSFEGRMLKMAVLDMKFKNSNLRLQRHLTGTTELT